MNMGGDTAEDRKQISIIKRTETSLQGENVGQVGL